MPGCCGQSQGQPGQPVGGESRCPRCGQLGRELEATQSALQAEQAQVADLRAQLANLQRSAFGRTREATPADWIENVVSMMKEG